MVYTIKPWIAHCPVCGFLNRFMEFQFLIQEHGYKASTVVNIYIYIYIDIYIYIYRMAFFFLFFLFLIPQKEDTELSVYKIS